MQDTENQWTKTESGKIVQAAAFLWTRGHLTSMECRKICSSTINGFLFSHLPMNVSEPIPDRQARELVSLSEDCEIVKKALLNEACPDTPMQHNRVDALADAEEQVRLEWANNGPPKKLEKLLSGKVHPDNRISYSPWPNDVTRCASWSR